MKIIDIKKLPLIPASHENNKDPGALKKVILKDIDTKDNEYFKMLNWAIIPINKSFSSHYHEDMDADCTVCVIPVPCRCAIAIT